MDDAHVLGLARTRRNDAVELKSLGHIKGLLGFTDGTHLVGFDEHRIARPQTGALFDARGMGDKKIIANDLQAVPQSLGHGAHAFDVILCKTVLHRNDRVVVGPPGVQVQQLIAVEAPVFAAPVVNPVVVVLGRSQVQANRHIAPWPKTSRFNGFDQGFNGPLIGAKLRPKSTFVGHTQVLALLGQSLARCVVHLGHPFQGLGEAVGAIGYG